MDIEMDLRAWFLGERELGSHVYISSAVRRFCEAVVLDLRRGGRGGVWAWSQVCSYERYVAHGQRVESARMVFIFPYLSTRLEKIFDVTFPLPLE